MAEDKDQNAKINLPTKTDDPKGWMGPVMAGGPPTVNSICPAPPTQFTLLFGGRREERRHGIKHPHGPCGSSTYVPLPKPNQTAFSWSKVALSLPFSISLYPPYLPLYLSLSTSFYRIKMHENKNHLVTTTSAEKADPQSNMYIHI